MSVKPGRGKFIGRTVEARPSVWRRTAGWIHGEILRSLGRPARLERVIASRQLVPCPIIAPVGTFWTWPMAHQQDWMPSSLSSFHSRLRTTDCREPGYQHWLENHALAISGVQQLTREENVSYLSCDIIDIWGTSASKPMDYGIWGIDEFPLLGCHELAEPVTEEHLQKNIRHWGLRLDRMLFAEYPWAGRRLYWLNDGDSHRSGAARYQVRRLGIAIPLTSRFCRYGINVPMIPAIRQQWHLFAAPTDEPFSSFFDVMNAFECPFDSSGLPCHMHDADKSGVVLKLAWLERGHSRTSAATNVSSAIGFPDFGKQLQQLTKESSPC